MRLTLRTLLAYLDDILEPSQTREIGRKIEDAPLAQELVTRIRDVVRRRRLIAPTLEGPESGVDPNIVAEYLDNQLTPAQVAQTERILLNSEMHLAEVASAHQILTLILGEPVEVLPESRKRMYALGPVSEEDKLVVESAPVMAPTIEPSDRLAVTASEGSAEAGDSTDAGVSLTDYVKERSGKRKWWPLIGVGLLGCLFVALQMTDPGKKPASDHGTTPEIASADPVTNQDAAPAASDEVELIDPPDGSDSGPPAIAAATPEPTEPNAGESAIAAAAPPANPGNAVDALPPLDEPPLIDLPPPNDAPPSTAAAEPTEVPGEPAMAATEPSGVDPATAKPGDTAAVPTGVEPGSTPDVTFVAPPGGADIGTKDMPGPPSTPNVITIPDKATQPAPTGVTGRLTNMSPSGILLRQMPDNSWKVAPRPGTISDGEGVASPKPYVTMFAVKDLPFYLHLGAGSRIRTYTAANASMGIQIERGQVVLSRLKDEPLTTPAAGADAKNKAAQEPPAAAPDNNEPVVLELKVADQTWQVTLPGSDCEIAFDATPVPPIRLDTAFDGFPYKVWAVGSVGAVTVKPADADAKTIGSEDRIALAGPSPGAVLVEPGAAANWLVSKDPVAKWVTGPSAPTEKRDAIRFQREFDPVDSIADTMPSLVRHERSWMARRAIQCLSLTSDYQALVRSLSVAEHDEATAEAIHGLREWLPSNPENGEMLKGALEQEFTDDDSLAIYQLLWGYDEAHARDPKTSRQLVRWLSADRPAIPRLAYFHILRLTGSQDDYRFNLSKDRLNSFRKRWERQIDKHGTLLND